jgi:hypothetical protein
LNVSSVNTLESKIPNTEPSETTEGNLKGFETIVTHEDGRAMAQAVSRRPLTAEGFVVDKVALGQLFPRVLRFSPVSFIPPVLHYTEKLIIFITALHNKPRGCGASVASAAGPFTTKKIRTKICQLDSYELI